MSFYEAKESDKDWIVLSLLSFFLGYLGIDRFYAGRVGLGIGKLLTLGGLGLWAFIDFILALCGQVKDAQGRYIRKNKNTMLAIVLVVLEVLFIIGVFSYIFSLAMLFAMM